MSDLIERAEKLLTQCAIHDYGLSGACGCPEPELDHRTIVADLLAEIQRLTESEDSRVVVLEAERDRFKAWNQEARTMLAGNQARIAGMQARLREANNLIQELREKAKRAKPVLDAAAEVVEAIRDADEDDELEWNDEPFLSLWRGLIRAVGAFGACQSCSPGGCAGHTRVITPENDAPYEQAALEIADVENALRKRIAERIRAELVCCDQYADLAHLRGKPGFEGYDELSRELRRHGDGICYWSEAAARIAEEGIERDGRAGHTKAVAE